MAGRVVQDPAPHEPMDFLTLRPPSPQDAQTFLHLMAMLHREPLSSLFARVQRGGGTLDEMLPVIHFFEEVASLVLHQLLSQELLFDAFAIDIYWDHLGPLVEQMRAETHNSKFAENFEELADMAREYRRRRSPRTAAHVV